MSLCSVSIVTWQCSASITVSCSARKALLTLRSSRLASSVLRPQDERSYSSLTCDRAGLLVCRSQQKDTQQERTPGVPRAPPTPGSSSGGKLEQGQVPLHQQGGDDSHQELEEAFRWFDWSSYTQPFDVPWGGAQLAVGMLAWSASFTLVGLAFIPIAVTLAGPQGFAGLSQVDKSLFALANQVCETAVGIAVVRAVVRGFEPLPGELFKYDLRAPFRKPDGWLAWGLLGVLLSPAFVYLAAVSTEALGYGVDGGVGTGRGTVDAVSSILSMDPVTFGSLFLTTSVLAPLLEETVFRGFLLTSLTKFMPVPAAVLLSSLAFGLVHLAPRDFPQLTSLGILLGFSYVRSRNLLTPILIHGTWNGAILTILSLLAASGVDVQELITQH